MLESEFIGSTQLTRLSYGIIKFISNEDYHIKLPRKTNLLNAKKALSCLVEPVIDDEVLVYEDSNQSYILFVLARSTTNKSTLNIANLICIENEEVRVNAKSIHLSAVDAIELQTDKQSVSCNVGQFRINQGQFSGYEMQFNYESIKFLCRIVRTACETIHTKAVQTYLRIAELEHQVIGCLRSIIKRSYRIDCQQIDIYSKNDAKIVAKQIHLG
ncbi:TPA: DUF3540 domain-containing protein [Legionella pneumophila]|jgi:hypothetical protein|uniref:DUF3540 domain-containing protein n=1 Tax=Legionella pneumophila TaxID=446 RepID=A0AAN5KTM1_LEGPN|nr:DUF3540 domain-containing protein [Legionella pneumophila]HAT1973389.1 DUF3540 domain-containing protein [Legionella pneumophila]HBC0465843.1 DUF3540 domain-containing protein [Legionella pneumophila]HDP0036637.1 DUF3540 domain-containing protein [Legionella pneumophila]HEN4771827.1 DUF3540 domain-containing protein [Legionella pneumophila]